MNCLKMGTDSDHCALGGYSNYYAITFVSLQTKFVQLLTLL